MYWPIKSKITENCSAKLQESNLVGIGLVTPEQFSTSTSCFAFKAVTDHGTRNDSTKQTENCGKIKQLTDHASVKGTRANMQTTFFGIGPANS